MTTTTTNNNGQNPAFTFSFDGELPYFSVNYSLNIEGNKNTFKKELTSKKTKFKARRGAELSNYLQNTLATVSDRKFYVYQNKLLQYGQAEVVTSQDYYPFGMEMMGSSDLYNPTNTNEYSGRVYHNKSLTDRNFRYGFNGKEKDDAFHQDITNYDYGFRIYNPGISRFLSVDPLTRDYPMLTPYQFASNTPIMAIDVDGKEAYMANILADMFLNYVKSTELYQNITKPTYDAKKKQAEYNGDNNFEPGLGNVDANYGNPRGTEALLGFVENAEVVLDIPMLADGITPRAPAVKIAPKVTAPKASTSIAKKEGIVYLRTDHSGNLKPYIGQAKNEERFLARQKEHARSHPDSDFEFQIIDRADPSGKFPTKLDKAEQKALDEYLGPTNKSHPDGGTSNKKNVIRKTEDESVRP